MSVVAMRPHLIAGNFVNTEYQRDCGVVVCRFFLEGDWKEVLIDTRLPFSDSVDARRPSYGHCLNNEEMWVPFLEKAMAKYRGSYEALHAKPGTLADALVDLTGGSIETHDLTRSPASDWAASGELWHMVKRWFSSGCLMAVVLEEEEDDDLTEVTADGILPNHAYGILDVAEVDATRLIRIRNPWGEGEWKGAFADHDQMWNKYPELKEKLQYVFSPDGTWWMAYEDWVSVFNKLHVVRLFPQVWHQVTQKGQWFEASAAGPPQVIQNAQGQLVSVAGNAKGTEEPELSPNRTQDLGKSMKSNQATLQPTQDPDPKWFNNPQYRLSLKTEVATTVYLSLLQSDKNDVLFPTNIMVLKAKASGRLWDCSEVLLLGAARETPMETRDREVTMEIAVDPKDHGKHFFIVCYQDLHPSIHGPGAKPDPRVQASFYLRAFSSEPIQLDAIPPAHTYTEHGEWVQGVSAGGRRLKGRMESSSWCKNPQMLVNFRKPTSFKIVCERSLGKGRRHVTHGMTVGLVVTRLYSTSTSTTSTAAKKKGTQRPGMTGTMGSTGKSLRDEDAPEIVDPVRKMQVLPTDWVRESSYANEEVACLFLSLTPQQGPIVIIPSLSEENIGGHFTLSVYADRPLKDAMMLNEKQNAVLSGSWAAETAGGCHLHAPPFEHKNSWSRNPKFSLTTPTRMTCKITLARCEKPWRSQVAKDSVGCMMGLYVMQGGSDVSRENVIAETTFVPGTEVTLECTLERCAVEDSYCVIPCTYDPGKIGEFMIRVCSESRFDFEAYS